MYNKRKPQGNYDKIVNQKFSLKFTDESYVNEAKDVIEIFKEENFKVNRDTLTNT